MQKIFPKDNQIVCIVYLQLSFLKNAAVKFFGKRNLQYFQK